MAKPARERLWIDAVAPPPAGWRRLTEAAEAGRWLHTRRVEVVSLGSPPELALAAAQLIEQGAFTGTLPWLAIEVRLEEGMERTMVQAAVDAARRHWDAVPLRPAPGPAAAKRGPRSVILRFLFWHLVGFAIAITVVEGWYLWRRGEHAPIVASALQLVGLAPAAPPPAPSPPARPPRR